MPFTGLGTNLYVESVHLRCPFDWLGLSLFDPWFAHNIWCHNISRIDYAHILNRLFIDSFLEWQARWLVTNTEIRNWLGAGWCHRCWWPFDSSARIVYLEWYMAINVDFYSLQVGLEFLLIFCICPYFFICFQILIKCVPVKLMLLKSSWWHSEVTTRVNCGFNSTTWLPITKTKLNLFRFEIIWIFT